MLSDLMLANPAGDDKLYVEDVFSTYLYTGNGGTQAISNGLDLAGKGGMVWVKARSSTYNNLLTDTARGAGTSSSVTRALSSNLSSGQLTTGGYLSAFNADGFTLQHGSGGTVNERASINGSGSTFTSWAFRKSAKFFDVVTWTGNGVSGRQIAHGLGVAPGCVIVKRTDTTGNWMVYHRGANNGVNARQYYLTLNGTAAQQFSSLVWPSDPTASHFSVDQDATLNASGGTYVAYVFAHDVAADGIIQCGSYTGNAAVSGPVVTLGWEPQWVMIKRVDSTGGWSMHDNMRGMPVSTSTGARLFANTTAAEVANNTISPLPTGFQVTATGADFNASGGTYIYIAIRRGPMRTPTAGESVFAPVFATNTTPAFVTGFPVDWVINRLPSAPSNNDVGARLIGPRGLATESATAEFDNTSNRFDYQNGVVSGSRTGYISWNFRRAPGFFDVVCYTGTGAARTVSHNLGVVPELMIVKGRSAAEDWFVYSASMGASEYLLLSEPFLKTGGSTNWNNTRPTSSAFSLGATGNVNGAGVTHIAYLFASCPGVSKIGTYTGNGAASQAINCGFSAGARFVLIKRVDQNGNWHVFDTARGIVAGNDPMVYWDSTAQEDSDGSADSIIPNSTGFTVNQNGITTLNIANSTYLYLAIA